MFEYSRNDDGFLTPLQQETYVFFKSGRILAIPTVIAEPIELIRTHNEELMIATIERASVAINQVKARHDRSTHRKTTLHEYTRTDDPVFIFFTSFGIPPEAIGDLDDNDYTYDLGLYMRSLMEEYGAIVGDDINDDMQNGNSWN